MSSETGDRTWGHLSKGEHYGRITDSSDYVQVDKSKLKTEPYCDGTQAGHCFIYAKNDEKSFGIYNPRASILMQMRFDGNLGFPGGVVEPGEDVVLGLNRELAEEVNLDLTKHSVTEAGHVVSHWCISKRLCLHFYALEVSLPELCEIEKRIFTAKDFGEEVLGTLRVPLYTMGDGYRGFPVFLSNAFAGASRQQLIVSLRELSIMSQEELELAQKAVAPHLQSS